MSKTKKGANKENMKPTSIFVDRKMWNNAKSKAAQEEITISAVVRYLVGRWLSGDVIVTKQDIEKDI